MIAIYLFIGSLIWLYPFLNDSIGAPEISDTERASVIPGYIVLVLLWGWIVPMQTYVEIKAYMDRKILKTFEEFE